MFLSTSARSSNVILYIFFRSSIICNCVSRSLASKKMKMDSDHLRSPIVATRLRQLPVQLLEPAVKTRKMTPEKRKDLDDEHETLTSACTPLTPEVETASRSPTPLSGSPPARKRRRTLTRSDNQPNEGICYESARRCTSKKTPLQSASVSNSVFRDSDDGSASAWRTDFLRKCAELVEVRFSNAIRITCVKPFCEHLSACWQDT